MDDTVQAEDISENRTYIAQLSLHQARVLEDASDTVDRKSATLLGFLALIVALCLQTASHTRHAIRIHRVCVSFCCADSPDAKHFAKATSS